MPQNYSRECCRTISARLSHHFIFSALVQHAGEIRCAGLLWEETLLLMQRSAAEKAEFILWLGTNTAVNGYIDQIYESTIVLIQNVVHFLLEHRCAEKVPRHTLWAQFCHKLLSCPCLLPPWPYHCPSHPPRSGTCSTIPTWVLPFVCRLSNILRPHTLSDRSESRFSGAVRPHQLEPRLTSLTRCTSTLRVQRWPAAWAAAAGCALGNTFG